MSLKTRQRSLSVCLSICLTLRCWLAHTRTSFCHMDVAKGEEGGHKVSIFAPSQLFPSDMTSRLCFITALRMETNLDLFCREVNASWVCGASRYLPCPRASGLWNHFFCPSVVSGITLASSEVHPRPKSQWFSRMSLFWWCQFTFGINDLFLLVFVFVRLDISLRHSSLPSSLYAWS